MIVHHTRACYHLVVIGIETSVVAIDTQCLCRCNIFSSIEHLQVFVHLLEPHITLIRDLESSSCSFLGFHLYNTRCST